ncbi:hypothetical protein OTU49_012853, partial [Cherax quadricarinatus]
HNTALPGLTTLPRQGSQHCLARVHNTASPGFTTLPRQGSQHCLARVHNTASPQNCSEKFMNFIYTIIIFRNLQEIRSLLPFLKHLFHSKAIITHTGLVLAHACKNIELENYWFSL